MKRIIQRYELIDAEWERSERFYQNAKAPIDDLLPWAENIRRQFRVWIIERLPRDMH